ncbi:uncharacterized protein LOC143036309 [Oratosquilla oratoria]|uniref:uncharacterized protein LOC143036309 n=1 Tax=Oratosquilla oratoria TaxID=337810 RepID=UPI003F76D1CD
MTSLMSLFDSGKSKDKYSDFVNKNYRWNEKDVDKGFKQGVIECYQALADNEECGLPRRFMVALENLRQRANLLITQADKGGGIVVMNKVDYDNKMLELLNDKDTYKKMDTGFAQREADKLKKNARKILSRSKKGKELLGLLEEAPRPPTMRGLPKIHKPDVPMRPITSGIGSAPHRLAKRLAKPLSATLGTISDAHLRNSADLIERLKLIDFKKKKMVSFDIKSLYTNVSIEGAMNAMKRALTNISEDELPIKKKDYIELVSLCVNFGAFVFKEQEYVQHRGLAMGSPLSAVMASLYMETLEVDKFIRIIGRGSKWFRYVDDILVIMPEESNINNKLRMLNDVNEHIQFTVEMEMEGKLSFLDTLIHREDSSAKFSVYRKPTNRDDFIHYLSRHSTRTKTER